MKSGLGIIVSVISVMGIALFLFSSPAEANLVSHWKFDEENGTEAVDSAGDNDGEVSGAVWTAGYINNSLEFDGTADYMLVEDPTDGSLDMGTEAENQ